MAMVTVSSEISKAYDTFMSALLSSDPRCLANDTARGLIHRVEAFPESAQPSIMEIPSGNRHMLWAYQQGILQRAYVTSTIIKYLARGVDSSVIGSANPDVPLAEGLIAENGVLPLSLETILGMSEAIAAATLQTEPELIAKLQLNNADLPKVDTDRLQLRKEDIKAVFETYWRPVKAKLDAELGRRTDTEKPQA